MNEADRSLLARLLDESFERAAAGIQAVPEERWATALGEGAWCPAEIAEHLVLTEHSVLRLLRGPLLRTPEVEPSSNAAEIDAVLQQRIPDRGGAARRAEAPERVRPTGAYGSAVEALAAFRESRQKVAEWIRTTDAELRRHRMPHPAIGEIDGVQWVIFLAMHCERHIRQMEEQLPSASAADSLAQARRE